MTVISEVGDQEHTMHDFSSTLLIWILCIHIVVRLSKPLQCRLASVLFAPIYTHTSNYRYSLLAY